MKKLILCVSLILVGNSAFALSATTSCPSGWVQIIKDPRYVVMDDPDCGYDEEEWIDGTSPMGEPSSCTGSRHNVCYLFIPANLPVSDSTGAYEYETLCELS